MAQSKKKESLKMTVLCYTAIVVGRERKWVCTTYVISLGD